MRIFPAIDLLDGKCVRLQKGDYATASKVAQDPIQTVHTFAKQGATHLHMVDLNGAKDGIAQAKNRSILKSIRSAFDGFIELGGGIRTLDDIEAVLSCGVNRAILGSSATNLSFLKEAIETFGNRIAVGVDAIGGRVAISGWLDVTRLSYLDFIHTIADMGVRYVIVTDIAKDGMLQGPNFSMLQALKDLKLENLSVTASGGVSTIEDLRHLHDMGLYGAICGKAVYTGGIDLKEAVSQFEMPEEASC
ncbi:MAG: 1-(5-phosphoribosyl)-5-[Clostridia bacterium]|nr:1-(5-phosphoribosyl)-5-[(5-phosphoribosylamino)methylideneamino]imidazole-4-carboxamide isomerase [Clostridia bacterium]